MIVVAAVICVVPVGLEVPIGATVLVVAVVAVVAVVEDMVATNVVGAVRLKSYWHYIVCGV